MTPQEIIERVEAGSVHYTESDRLEWIEGCAPDGYGLVWIGDCRKDYVHHLMMKAHGHDIEGLTVDHLCELRGCSNPRHLEVVPNGENAHRARLRVASAPDRYSANSWPLWPFRG
jgi:hypothetical protein